MPEKKSRKGDKTCEFRDGIDKQYQIARYK